MLVLLSILRPSPPPFFDYLLSTTSSFQRRGGQRRLLAYVCLHGCCHLLLLLRGAGPARGENPGHVLVQRLGIALGHRWKKIERIKELFGLFRRGSRANAAITPGLASTAYIGDLSLSPSSARSCALSGSVRA